MTRRSATRQYPDVAAGPAAAQPRGDRAVRGELHGLHAVRARVPGLVHLHRLAQGDGRASPGAARARQRNVLDRFAIDFSLCMYCGICIEVCPFDALFWSPEFEYAEYDIRTCRTRRTGCGEWMWTVPPPPAHDPTGRAGQGGRRRARRPPRPPGVDGVRRRPGAGLVTTAEVVFACSAWSRWAPRCWWSPPGSWCTPALWLVVALGALAGCYLVLTAELVAWCAAADLRRRGRGAAAVRGDADPGADRAGRTTWTPATGRPRWSVALATGRPAGRAAGGRLPLARTWTCPTVEHRQRGGDRRGRLPDLGAAVRGASRCCCSPPWSARSCCPAATSARRTGGERHAPALPARARRAAVRRRRLRRAASGATRCWC